MLVYSSVDQEELYKLYGQCGGSGGDGGKGGIGGNNGLVEIFPLNADNSQSIKIQNESGRAGDDGPGGTAGKTVVITAICHSKKVTTFFIPMKTSVIWYEKDTSSDDNCGEKQGRQGQNAGEIMEPSSKAPPLIPFIINEYMAFVRTQQNTSEDIAMAFIDAIDNHADIQSTYDTIGLVNELYTIEYQLLKQSDEIDLTKPYEMLQKRVGEYLTKRKPNEQSIEYENILSFIQTSAINRLAQLKEAPMQPQNSGKGSQIPAMMIDKDIIIEQYSQMFDSEMHKMQNEANDFIINQITPEINKIYTDLEFSLKNLASETVAWQNAVIEAKRKNEYELDKLRQTLHLRNIFTTLKTITSFIGFFGPYGVIVEAVISGAINFLASLLVSENQVTVAKPVDLPPSIKHIVKNVGRSFKINIGPDSREKKINRKLNQLATLLDDYIENISNETNSDGNNGNGTDSIDAYNATNSRRKMFEELDVGLSTFAQQIQNSSTIQKLNASIGQSNVDAEWFISKKEPQMRSQKLSTYTDVAALEGAIETLNGQLKSLQDYEKRIYNILYPMIRNIQHDLKDLQRNLHNQSHVILDFAKLKVQGALKDFQIELLLVTRGFKVEDKVQVIIKKIDETMVALIGVFDRIQSYADQERLAKHIANLNSAKSRRFNVKNSQLQAALNQLEAVLNINNALRSMGEAPASV